jgi:hypothetical protein
MSTSKKFRRLEIGDYFSIPGISGILCKKVKYQRWGEGAVRGGYNYLVLKHLRKESLNCGGYAMPDTEVVTELREKHLKRFSDLEVGKCGAFRDEPSTVVKKIWPKRLRSGGKLVNAVVISTGIVKAKLAEHLVGTAYRYLFISPNEHLFVA